MGIPAWETNSNFTVFIVTRRGSTGNPYYPILGGDPVHYQGVYLWQQAGYAYVGRSSSTRSYAPVTPSAAGDVWTVVDNGGYWSLYQGTAARISSAYLGHVSNPVGGGPGAFTPDGVNYYYYDGWIGEIVVYNRALNATELLQVQSFLRSRWGTP